MKKAHRISNKTIIIIDEILVEQLSIDENTWFEQIQTEDGILLKIQRKIINELKPVHTTKSYGVIEK